MLGTAFCHDLETVLKIIASIWTFHHAKKSATWHTRFFLHIVFNQSVKIWNVRHVQRFEEIDVTQRHIFVWTSSTVQAIPTPAKFRQNFHICSGSYATVNFVQFYSDHPLFVRSRIYPLRLLIVFFNSKVSVRSPVSVSDTPGQAVP